MWTGTIVDGCRSLFFAPETGGVRESFDAVTAVPFEHGMTSAYVQPTTDTFEAQAYESDSQISLNNCAVPRED